MLVDVTEKHVLNQKSHFGIEKKKKDPAKRL